MVYVLFFHLSTQRCVPPSKHVPSSRCPAGCRTFRDGQGTVAAWDPSLVGEKTLSIRETSYTGTRAMCYERMHYWCLQGRTTKWPWHKPGETRPPRKQLWIQVRDQLHFSNWSVFMFCFSLNFMLLLNDALQNHKQEKDWDKIKGHEKRLSWKFPF